MNKIKDIFIGYYGGESRYHTGEAADYMIAEIKLSDGDVIELYAEAPTVTGDETATYEGLKAEIIAQAIHEGIDPERLQFFYD